MRILFLTFVFIEHIFINYLFYFWYQFIVINKNFKNNNKNLNFLI